MNKVTLALAATMLLALLIDPSSAFAEDGYDLWLRYPRLDAAEQTAIRSEIAAVVTAQNDSDPALAKAALEIQLALDRMLGKAPSLTHRVTSHSLVLGVASSPLIKPLRLSTSSLGTDGYLIRSVTADGVPAIAITANSGVGVLYGAFALLQRIELGLPMAGLDVTSTPKLKLRLLDHWDNLDGSVERGYAGESLWDWWKLPDFKDPRYTDYARANASIGINGAVLNNVNAKSDSLTAAYLAKTAALAEVFRPYGIKVYLSVRWTAPMELSGLSTADPLDPKVVAWWKAKADEIYRSIPDFGGFLVKANSEGQPGPQDYGRNHADGANMLAAALAPHGGVVMWRAFVYSAQAANQDTEDRAKQAYDEFKPLDGKFAPNVLLQVKNGPIDFQPREPFHPLFGAMPRTPLMLEFQITKEYLGFATHLAYLGPMYEETLRSDTFAKGKGSTVARVIDGTLDSHTLTGMAGVANIGRDRDWSGSTFNQANWFVFGRLAWDPDSSTQDVAAEWSRLTFGRDPVVTKAVVGLMSESREAVVNYMTPLGLAHQMATGHHYGPGPWIGDLKRAEWNPSYYSRADASGIGFDRTKSGSNAVAQYAGPVAAPFSDPKTTGPEYLLWFHHLPWDYRLGNGQTLWNELCRRYTMGVLEVTSMRKRWEGLRGKVDPERFEKTERFLGIQEREAQWWRDASIAYFASKSGLPLPPDCPPPAHDLAYYEGLTFKYAPGGG
jgi:alpha-glucuronidase